MTFVKSLLPPTAPEPDKPWTEEQIQYLFAQRAAWVQVEADESLAPAERQWAADMLGQLQRLFEEGTGWRIH